MRAYSSKELIRIIEKDGWFLVNSAGSHWQFKHPTKPGKVTVTHPVKDVPTGTARGILKQAGIILK